MSHALMMTVKVLYQAAKQKRSEGKIPQFLGLNGMLALMHDRIVKFHETESTQYDYILDLAVDALMALDLTIPDEEEFDIPDPVQDESETDSPTPVGQDDTDEADSARWTAVKPGQDLSTVKPQGSKE